MVGYNKSMVGRGAKLRSILEASLGTPISLELLIMSMSKDKLIVYETFRSYVSILRSELQRDETLCKYVSGNMIMYALKKYS